MPYLLFVSISRPLRSLVAIVAVVGEVVLCGCRQSCELKELTKTTEVYSKATPKNIEKVPVIVVAQILSKRVPDSEWRPGPHGPNWPTRRYRMRIKVENVLQGNVPLVETEIYFFSAREVSGGAFPIAFSAGDREILFLQKDCGHLRTICDNWDGCCSIGVFSGAHPAFKRDYSQPVNTAIADILTTTGKGVTDQQFGEAIRKGVRDVGSSYPTIVALRDVLHDRGSPYREHAKRILAPLAGGPGFDEWLAAPN